MHCFCGHLGTQQVQLAERRDFVGPGEDVGLGPFAGISHVRFVGGAQEIGYQFKLKREHKRKVAKDILVIFK